MTLQRFNQLLTAVLGTSALVGGAALAVFAALAFRDDGADRILVDHQASDRPRQELLFCEPTLVPESGLQLLPIAVRTADDSKDARLTSPPTLPLSKSADRNRSCNLSRYGWSGQIFNVVVRAPRTNQQHLLLDRPAQIEALHLPDENCGQGKGSVPCGLLQWHIRDTDSNGDGAISEDDALIAYHSTAAVGELRPVTPREASLERFVWDPEQKSMLFLVRFDRSGDKKFDAQDPTEILELTLAPSAAAKEIVTPEIRRQLEEQVR